MIARLELLQKALIAERSGRHRQMVALMREVAEMNVALSLEERETLMVAYHKLLNEKTKAHSKLRECIREANPTEEVLKSLETLQNTMKKEVTNICAEVTGLIARHILPSATTPESEVLYKKWHADTLRVAVRYAENEAAGAELEEASKNMYKMAVQEAVMELPPTNVIRLTLALNYATFRAEVLNDVLGAVELSDSAIEDASAEWTGKRSKAADQAATVIHLLHQNTLFWSTAANKLSHLDPASVLLSDSEACSSIDDHMSPIVSPAKHPLPPSDGDLRSMLEHVVSRKMDFK
eukprot:TRINITY_DN699_c1_g1_i1.p1 TRINITY_DN699_c1_g1~~TRINITY_DN699_c1_g1_i1.p1  ORF type:complete len:311 (+),score=71.39 TRINITY_DN699_c1_g1_i1:52-933(+)